MACRQVKDKRELIRLVRTPSGIVEVDSTGKKDGRGVYLCRMWKCCEAGLKGDRIGHALKTRLTPGDNKRLIEQAKAILEN